MTLDLDPNTRALLPEIADRHVAFLRARLVSEAARGEWRDNMAAAWATWLATPVEHIVDAEAVARALDENLGPAPFTRALAPLADAVVQLESARLREETKPLGDFVPAEVRAQIDRLLETPGMVPEGVLREVLENAATGAVMRDVLYDVLKEFSQKVNPFLADWGLPAILKRLGPFGMGGMLKSFESMRAEFDRRIEPEIRNFLAGFSRRALKNMADSTIAKIDGPEFVDLRKVLVARLLEQPVCALVPRHDDERAAMARTIVLSLARHALGRDDMRRQRRAAIELAVRAHAKQPLGVALAVYGVDPAVDIASLADATWPAVRAALGSDAVGAWLERITREFYVSLAG